MNEETLKRMPEYVRKLPKSIQDLVFDGVWEERTVEIAKKYSLNPTQTDTLANNVLLVLIALDAPENFTKLMTSELGISKILADQIIEDLETRVFEYALKTIENKEKKNPNSPLNQVPKESKLVEKLDQKKIPEIKPANLPMGEIKLPITSAQTGLPMIEKGEMAHNVPPLSKPIIPSSYKPSPAEQNKPKIPENRNIPQATLVGDKSTAEQIQRPIPVPRFTGATINDTLPLSQENPKLAESNSKTTPLDIMNSKLHTVSKKIEEKPVEKTNASGSAQTETKSSPTHSYTVDPYREPME